MKKFRVGLVGISGYAGMELVRLLTRHPFLELAMACSRAEKGHQLQDFYPFLRDLPGGNLIIEEYSPEGAEKCDLVFLSVPAGTAMQMAPELLRRGKKVVDFSADFRLNSQETYEEWYNIPHQAPDLLADAVYGLPELNSEKIDRARLVANPGCYPTACILGLAAFLRHDLIEPQNLVIDAKSGASGAGRKPAIPTLFCEISDNFRAYGSPRHRHTPEIEQELGKISDCLIRLTFTPHIAPMKRGILATIYATPKTWDEEAISSALGEFWAPYPWVRTLGVGKFPETANVRGSMFCDIGFCLDKRAGRVVIFSAIDNLCRGASGQALANANLMLGMSASTGLEDLCPLA